MVDRHGEAGEPGTLSPGRVASLHGNKKSLLARLSRIEGQVRGIARMIEEDQYCVDILMQIAAARAALNRVGLIVLESHTKGCVTNAVKHEEGEAVIDELMDVLMRFIR